MRPSIRLLTALALVLLALAPASALAQSTSGGAPAPDATGGTPAGTAQLALAANPDELLGSVVHFSGQLSRADAGRTVTVQRYWDLLAAWGPIATATVASDGTYDAYWRADHIGRQRFRSVIDHGDDAAASGAPAEVALTIYKPATATWYGPGFFGRRTACGQLMTHRLLGVAHKRLPCGTQVALYVSGRTVTVPVVDRGPFRHNTDWDLTFATAHALGVQATSTIGALRIRTAPARRR